MSSQRSTCQFSVSIIFNFVDDASHLMLLNVLPISPLWVFSIIVFDFVIDVSHPLLLMLYLPLPVKGPRNPILNHLLEGIQWICQVLRECMFIYHLTLYRIWCCSMLHPIPVIPLVACICEHMFNCYLTDFWAWCFSSTCQFSVSIIFNFVDDASHLMLLNVLPVSHNSPAGRSSMEVSPWVHVQLSSLTLSMMYRTWCCSMLYLLVMPVGPHRGEYMFNDHHWPMLLNALPALIVYEEVIHLKRNLRLVLRRLVLRCLVLRRLVLRHLVLRRLVLRRRRPRTQGNEVDRDSDNHDIVTYIRNTGSKLIWLPVATSRYSNALMSLGLSVSNLASSLCVELPLKTNLRTVPFFIEILLLVTLVQMNLALDYCWIMYRCLLWSLNFAVLKC